MKVRVSMPGAYIAIDFEDDKGMSVFQKLSETMMNFYKQEKPKQKVSNISVVQDARERNETVNMNPADELKQDKIQEVSEEEAAPPLEYSTGFGGFLYIKCPECGKIKGFCAKTRLNNFRCECGCVTKLKNLVPLYMNCECGRNSRYLTNMEEEAFDIECYDCGAPVAVEWNEKKRQYETMRNR